MPKALIICRPLSNYAENNEKVPEGFITGPCQLCGTEVAMSPSGAQRARGNDGPTVILCTTCGYTAASVVPKVVIQTTEHADTKMSNPAAQAMLKAFKDLEKKEAHITQRRTEETACPNCGAMLGAVTHLADRPGTKPDLNGHHTVCMECGAFLTFTDNEGHLRLCTEEEKANFLKDLNPLDKVLINFAIARTKKKRQ